MKKRVVQFFGITIVSLFVVVNMLPLKAENTTTTIVEEGFTIEFDGELLECVNVNNSLLRGTKVCTIDSLSDLKVSFEGNTFNYYKQHVVDHSEISSGTTTQLTMKDLNPYSLVDNTNNEFVLLTYRDANSTLHRLGLNLNQDEVVIDELYLSTELKAAVIPVNTFYYDTRVVETNVKVVNALGEKLYEANANLSNDAKEIIVDLTQFGPGQYDFIVSATINKDNGVVLHDEKTFQLTAYPNADYITASFDLNGGEGAVPMDQVVTKGSKLIEPSKPTRTGYKFLGWFEATAGKWDFATMVASNDITLIANWEKVKVEEKEVDPDIVVPKDKDEEVVTPEETINPKDKASLPKTGISSVMPLSLGLLVIGSVIIIKNKK